MRRSLHMSLVGLGIASALLAAISGVNVGMSIVVHSEKTMAANGRLYMHNTFAPKCQYLTIVGLRGGRGVGEGEGMYCRWLAPAPLLNGRIEPT